MQAQMILWVVLLLLTHSPSHSLLISISWTSGLALAAAIALNFLVGQRAGWTPGMDDEKNTCSL